MANLLAVVITMSPVLLFLFIIFDLVGVNLTIKSLLLRRKILKLLSPKINITKENLEERKIDLNFLETLLEEGVTTRPPVKIFIEKFLLSYDFIEIDVRSSYSFYSREKLEINKYSGMNKEILREIVKAWGDRIESLESEDNLEKEIESILAEELESEDNLEKEIESILAEEIESAESIVLAQKKPVRRSNKYFDTEVEHAAQVVRR